MFDQDTTDRTAIEALTDALTEAPVSDKELTRITERALVNRHRDRMIRAANLYADRGSVGRADALLITATLYGDC